MARGWKCARCSRQNDEGAIACTNCGLIRGSVVVPTTFTPASGWGAGATGDEKQAEPPTGPRDTTRADEVRPLVTDPTVAQAASDPMAAQAASDPMEAAAASDPMAAQAAPTEWAAPAGWATPATPAAPAAPTSAPLWQRIPGWLVVAVLVGAGAIGGLIFNAGRAPTGEINKAGDLTAADLRVGDCFDLKDPDAEEIDQVTAVPCTSEHELEMFFVGSLPAGAYPGADGFEAFVGDNCVAAFGAYVGTSYQESELEIFWLEPTDDAWDAGDRAVQCAIYHPRIQRLRESMKGSNR
ncbi:MAG: septum formation family protein [Chloroflexi bacterium]|nr:septum formation family protein [Chloroflexota bacterium]